MPSWNIHTAHVERLLHEEDPWRLGIDDVNCFQFGNYVPDVYVGYMVKGTTRTIEYRTTHLADANAIPCPRYNEFWERFVARGGASDVTLGAWAHLVCDSLYNQATRELLDHRGLEVSPKTRVMKQRDFALFGSTIPLSRHVEVSDELVEQCETYPHYPIVEPDVRAAAAVANGIVDGNAAHRITYEPDYELLDEGFFLETFERVNARLLSRLRAYGRRKRSGDDCG
jgi:hypothetical protein